jgi:hypothetical protein
VHRKTFPASKRKPLNRKGIFRNPRCRCTKKMYFEALPHGRGAQREMN